MTEPAGGFLLLDKPKGVSSFQALRPVKKLYRGCKVGHAGTLDPAASGLLVVGVGSATRLLEYMEGLPKTYAFVLRLGVATDSYDMEGRIVATGDATAVTPDKVEAALAAFRGAIRQVPPAYSAVKVGGERAYALARAGETVALAARDAFVHSLELKKFFPDDGEGAAARGVHAILETVCSKGTYVRSLAHDLGQALGCGGAADDIRRLAVGSFRVENAVAPEALGNGDALLPLDAALQHLPLAVVRENRVAELLRGRLLPPDAYAWSGAPPHPSDDLPASLAVDGIRAAANAPSADRPTPSGDWRACRAVDGRGRLLAIAVLDGEKQLCPRKVLARP